MLQDSVDRIGMITNRHGRERKAWNPDTASCSAVAQARNAGGEDRQNHCGARVAGKQSNYFSFQAKDARPKMRAVQAISCLERLAPDF
jgi:hypothetical protein